MLGICRLLCLDKTLVRCICCLARFICLAVGLDHQVMVLLSKFSYFSYLCMQIGCMLSKIAGFRDLGAHLLVLLKLGILFSHLAFHLFDLFDQFAFLVGSKDLCLLAVLH